MNKPHTAESKQLMRLARLGKPSPNKGRKIPKLSLSLRGKTSHFIGDVNLVINKVREYIKGGLYD